MKKVIVLLVVAALTLISSVAMAEISMSGVIDTRSWNVNNTDFNKNNPDHNRRTQTRVRLSLDGKAGDAKARVTIENDWEEWGAIGGMDLEQPSANGNSTGNTGWLDLREAWVSIPLPGNLTLKGGHQLLQLGHGWFFRNAKYGSDAWVLYTDIDNLHLGFVNVKAAEGNVNLADDVDAYVVVATYKLDDNMKIGVDLTDVKIRYAGGPNPNEMFNIGINFAGQLGPVNLKAELDQQMGDNGAAVAVDYEGMQIIAQASMALDPVTVRATIGMGSGEEASAGTQAMVVYLDNDPRLGAIYEYLVGQPAGYGVTAHQGMRNATVLGVGADMKLTDSLSGSVDLLQIAATEAPAGQDDAIGTELAVRLNWKLADAVNWKWTIAQLKAGDAWGAGAEDPMAIYGILSVKF